MKTQFKQHLHFILFFFKTGQTQSLLFWSNFDPLFQDGRNRGNKKRQGKTQPSAIQIRQSQAPISSSLEMKNRITFCTFWSFLDKKQAVSKGQNQNLTYAGAYAGAINCDLLNTQRPNTFQFYGHWCQTIF